MAKFSSLSTFLHIFTYSKVIFFKNGTPKKNFSSPHVALLYTTSTRGLYWHLTRLISIDCSREWNRWTERACLSLNSSALTYMYKYIHTYKYIFLYTWKNSVHKRIPTAFYNSIWCCYFTLALKEEHHRQRERLLSADFQGKSDCLLEQKVKKEGSENEVKRGRKMM